MSDVWKQWEGQLADNKFPLHHFLAATNHSAVFLTQLPDPQPRQAAIKFISADDPAAGQQLAVWNQVAKLSHPNLVRLFHWGRCRLEGMNLLYVVMECAEENLGQILPQRALTPDETRDMLTPIVDVLAYLHAKFFVHSHIKPSNLLAFGDQLKVSSDTICPITQPREALREPDVYDAPEAASSPAKPSTPSSDVWSLGVTLVEALTQAAPALPFDVTAEPIVPSSLPQPFIDIARHSLRRDPKERWAAPQIAARLSGVAEPVAAPAPSVAFSAAAGSAASTATGGGSPRPPAPASSPLQASSSISPLSVPLSPEPAIPLSKLPAVPSSRLPKLKGHAAEPASRSRRTPGLATFVIPALVGALILVVGILGLPRFLRLHTEPAASSTPQMASADSTPSRPAPAPKAVSSSSADLSSPMSDPLKVSATPPKPADSVAAENAPVDGTLSAGEKSAAPAVLHSESSRSTATAKPAASNPAHGEVLDQVLPTANAKAMASIHGAFHVTARVQVDPSGKVTKATLEDPGPSKYFANLTEKAARQWQFTSPESDGHFIPSEWLIRFDFSSSGVHAIPTQTAP
ncbi:MAG TPA: protein kinase [Candidatus Acidoferrum sp.]|jgi:serine/threonine protein kinase